MRGKREIVFRTPFFSVEAKYEEGELEPYYSLKLPDYVCVVAYHDEYLVCVQQYRHAVDGGTLELPSGLIDDPSESPEAAARRELEEETGYIAGEMFHLGTLYTDTGRLQNRLWVYLTRRVRTSPKWVREEKVEPTLLSPEDLDARIRSGQFKHALHLAALELARHANDTHESPSNSANTVE